MAKLAESACLGNEDGAVSESKMAKLMDEVRVGRGEVQQLTARMSRMSMSASQPRSPTPERRQPCVSFQEPTPSMQRPGGPPTYSRGGRMFLGQSRPYNGGVGRPFSRLGAGFLLRLWTGVC